MKSIFVKLLLPGICLFALAFTTQAQSSGSFYLRDANYLGYTYTYNIYVYDNDLGSFVPGCPDPNGPFSAAVNATNNFITSITVPYDVNYQRWRIVIVVTKSQGGGTQNGFSGLLTTNQYLAGGVSVSQVNF
jgi:hypothetical protein